MWCYVDVWPNLGLQVPPSGYSLQVAHRSMPYCVSLCWIWLEHAFRYSVSAAGECVAVCLEVAKQCNHAHVSLSMFMTPQNNQQLVQQAVLPYRGGTAVLAQTAQAPTDSSV